MSDEKSQEKPTVEFAAPPKWAEGMFGRVHESINGMEARVNTRIDELRTEHGTKLDHCISGLKTVNGAHEKLAEEFHTFKGETTARFETHSMRAKQESISDEETRQEVKAIKAEMSESQMAKLLSAAAKTPQGQKVINALVVFVLAALSVGTGWLVLHGGK